jgi:FtsZ-interacting cell division protein ZipA
MGSMKNMTTHGATFLLDVPRVANGARAFGQMLELARRVAEVLKGILVDDNRQPLYDQELEPIRQQIIRYQSIMQEQGLPPGNPFTQRLFS